MSKEFQPNQTQFYSGTPLGKRETTETEQRLLTDIVHGDSYDIDVDSYESGAVIDYGDVQRHLGERWYDLEGVEHLIVSDSENGLRETINAHLENNRPDPITSDDWSKPFGTSSSY